MTDLAEMNKTQADTIKRQWVRISRMMKRIEWLRRENNDLAARVAELECPKRRAEQYFTTEGQE